jgi:hypothetical protein
VDESAFDINMKSSVARSAKSTSAIVTTPTTREVFHTIIGTISVKGVVYVEIRLPNLKQKGINADGSSKRKQS